MVTFAVFGIVDTINSLISFAHPSSEFGKEPSYGKTIIRWLLCRHRYRISRNYSMGRKQESTTHSPNSIIKIFYNFIFIILRLHHYAI